MIVQAEDGGPGIKPNLECRVALAELEDPPFGELKKEWTLTVWCSPAHLIIYIMEPEFPDSLQLMAKRSTDRLNKVTVRRIRGRYEKTWLLSITATSISKLSQEPLRQHQLSPGRAGYM
jgi:hypothetical protein